MSKFIKNEKLLRLSKMLTNFNKDVAELLEIENDIMDKKLVSDIQSAIDDSKDYMSSIGRVGDELFAQDIDNVEENLNYTLQKIYDTVKQRKEPLSPEQLSVSMLNISKKLDEIIKNQAKEKEKLTKVELEIKNIEADSLKNYLTQPFVPKEDVKIIFTALRKEFSIILTAFKTKGFQPFIDEYGLKFMESIDKTIYYKEPEKRLQQAIFEAENKSLVLIRFLEDANDWKGINTTIDIFREDMTYEELKEVEKILKGIDCEITGEHSSYFSKKFYNIMSGYTRERELPMLLQYLRKAGVRREKTEADYKRSRKSIEEYKKICAKR